MADLFGYHIEAKFRYKNKAHDYSKGMSPFASFEAAQKAMNEEIVSILPQNARLLAFVYSKLPGGEKVIHTFLNTLNNMSLYDFGYGTQAQEQEPI
jgi:hypothetical protein